MHQQKDKPFNRSYIVEMLGMSLAGKKLNTWNVDMETFQKISDCSA